MNSNSENSKDSIHLRRTMMSNELAILLTNLPINAEPDEYREAIINENILGKKTLANRLYTAVYLAKHYTLSLENDFFRLLRFCYDQDANSFPLLACLYTVKRDSLFHFSSKLILESKSGASLDKTDFFNIIQSEYTNRYSESMMRSLSRNIASSWTQSGHLRGRVQKYRTTVNTSPISVLYALALGYLAGNRGYRLLDTVYMRLMDRNQAELEELLFQLSKLGLIDFHKTGNVMELRFNEVVFSEKK